MQESARHLEMTRARQMRVDTRDLAEADFSRLKVCLNGGGGFIYSFFSLPLCLRTGFTGFNNSQKFHFLKMSFFGSEI